MSRGPSTRSAITSPSGDTTVDFMAEDLVRAHSEAHLSQATEIRRSYEIARARRLARKAERAAQAARLALARAL